MTTETAPISREALRFTREQKRISQRELGRRVAKRLGRAEATRSLQVKLSRIETGDEISEEDREFVDAIAAELALGQGDLGTPPRWIWFAMRSGGPSFVGFGLRIPAYSTPEKAYESRDALGLATNGASTQAFKDTQLVPIHGAASTTTLLTANYGPDLTDDDRDFLLPLDPTLDDLGFFWTLQLTLNSGGTLIDDTAAFAVEQRGFQIELFRLHGLALLRLKNIQPEAEHLREQWEHEEETLFKILKRMHELSRAQVRSQR